MNELKELDNTQEALYKKYVEVSSSCNSLYNIVNNLSQIVANLTTADKSKEVIAIANDGTEITIGHVLNSTNLIPKVKEEWKTATFTDDRKHDPEHYCAICGKHIGFIGCCSKECRDIFYDRISK